MTTLLLSGLFASVPAASFIPPLPPPPPGWTPIAPLFYPYSQAPAAFGERDNGSATFAAAHEYDPFMSGYNVTVFTRTTNGWSGRQIQTWLLWVNSETVATTDQNDRAGVFADLGSDGGPPSVFVSLIAKGATAGTPVVVSDTPNPQMMGMAANPEGNIMVLWRDIDSNYTIYSNHSA